MNKRFKIFIVDDDLKFLEELYSNLSKIYEVEKATGVFEFKKKYRIQFYDLVILDLKLRDGVEGLGLLKWIIGQDPLQPVIILTGYGTTELYTRAIENGAFLFLRKQDFNMPAIIKLVEILLEQGELKRRIQQLEKRLSVPQDIIGNSNAIQKIKEKIRIAGEDGQITVLIRGESGTGKELVARSIHRLGVRKNGPFRVALISAYNKETLYNELFGHEKGAFTGAVSLKKGIIEESNKGILFLDEIGDLNPEGQIKLLRVLETKSFTRMGGTREVKVDVQFVTATNRNLEELVKNGSFREDLYFRLKAFEIYIPPLRERREDIPQLSYYFLNQMFKSGRTTANIIHENVMAILDKYYWPGNVRELKYTIEFAALKAKFENSKIIEVHHLPNLENLRKSFNETGIWDYRKYLAHAELELVENAIIKRGLTRKVDLAEFLHYPNRFTFTRRIRGILEQYEEFKEEFRFVSQLFYKSYVRNSSHVKKNSRG